MARATAQEVAAMDAAQAEVTRLLKAAEERAALIEKSFWPKTDLEEASLTSIRGIRLRFNQWVDSKSGMKRWALDGVIQDETGIPRQYTPQEWLDFGKELGELAAEEASMVLTTGLFTLYTPVGALLRPGLVNLAGASVKVETAVRHVADAIGDALDPNKPGKPWSLKTKLLVGGGVAVVLLGGAAYLASSFTPLLQLLAAKKGGRE